MIPDNVLARAVPLRALALSLGALAVPAIGALALPDSLGEYGALLWLLALVPAFLLAYHRGWQGVATALAAGMATLSATQVAAMLMGRSIPDLLLAVVVAYLFISLGVGWLAETLHRDRDQVEDMAFTDLLTRLPNRRHARVFLQNEFAAAERGRVISVVLFDLDHFKDYNDRFGHAAGDDALQAFAGILARVTRRMDLSARFGGEEFISILTGSDREGALVFAERIRTALLTTPLEHGSITVSAGVAAYHPSMRSPDELLAAADHALYGAKRDGRNRVRLFGSAMLGDAEVSPDAAAALRSLREGEVAEYPRDDDELGASPPSLDLLPHQITEFGIGRKALLVEDDPQVLSLVSDYLCREGFTVTESHDAVDATLALDTDFDVAICDVRLPGQPGTEIVRAVKSRWPATQVLVITGLKEASVAAEALNAGADRYMFKPFGMPDLRAYLVDALARRDRILEERRRRADRSGAARERSQEARQAVVTGVRSLVQASEMHAPFARGHASRVAAYAEHIRQAMDPEGQMLDAGSLALAAELHDVGMLGVSDAILNQEGRLDPDQMDRVRQHPLVGRQILAPVLDDDVVLSVVTWHHERWDGDGYPNGLAGEAIPLPARIVAFASVLDALTTPRPYRGARGWEEAWHELREEAGKQFDPAVVRAAESCVMDLLAAYEGGRSGATT